MSPAPLPATSLTRRSLLFGAAALGGSLALSGCIGSSPTPAASNGASDTATTLTLQSSQSDPKPKAALVALIKNYTKYPTTLNTVAIEQFRAQLPTYLTSANPPDVITWYAGSVARDYASKGLLLDLSDLWTGDGACAKFSPALKSLSSDESGKQIFVPTNYYWWSIFYRKSAFEEWGVKAPTSWDDFMGLLRHAEGQRDLAADQRHRFDAVDGLRVVRLPRSASQWRSVPSRAARRQALVRQRRSPQGDGHLRHAAALLRSQEPAPTAGRKVRPRWSTRRPACI